MEIDHLLAERQISEFQIEVFSYYDKLEYELVIKLLSAAYRKGITSITMPLLTYEVVSCWSTIKMDCASNGK